MLRYTHRKSNSIKPKAKELVMERNTSNLNLIIEHFFDEIRNKIIIDANFLSLMYCLLCVKRYELEKETNETLEINTTKELKNFIKSSKSYFGESVYNAIYNLLENGISEDIFSLLSQFLLNENFLTGSESVIAVSEYIADKYLPDITNNEHSTPDWLNRLAVSFLNPMNGSFYDGVCGFGNTAFYAYYHSLKHNGDLSIYTQEINIFVSNIFVVRAFLEKINIGEHICGDTITNPTFLDKKEKFDYSIMFPPLGMSNNTGNLYSYELQQHFPDIDISKATQDWYFALTQIAMLKENGKGLLCVSNGALFNATGKDIRKAILDMNIIEAIISFPPNSLNHTAVPVNFILFNKEKKAKAQILMLNAEPLMDTNTISSNRKRFVFDKESREKLIATYFSNQPAKNICKLLDVSEIVDSNLLPSKYIKKIVVDTQDFGEVTISPNLESASKNSEWRTLGEVAEITIGMNNAKFTEPKEGGELRIIRLSDVQNNTLQLSTIQNYRLIGKDVENLKKYKVAQTDILLSCKGPAIKICMVPQVEDNIYISANFFSLKAKFNIIHPLYLKYYLESPIGQYFIKNKQTGSSIIMISSVEIKKLPIFYIPMDKQMELIEKLYATEVEINEKISNLSKKLVDNKWDFYNDIGVAKFMKINKEDTE